MSNWTDSIEKTLTTIRHNTKKLSENYLGDYNTFKNRLMYLNAPLVVLSVLNAYTVFELNSFSNIVHIGSVSTSVLIAAILGGEMCFGVHTSIEKEYNKFKDFEALQAQIDEVLTVDRADRKIDPNVFMMNIVQKYKDLTKDEPYITRVSNEFQTTVTDSIEDVHTFVEDHWNILFRPYFRQIKKKNEKVIQALQDTSQKVQDTLETITETVVKEPVNTIVNQIKPTADRSYNILSQWLPSWNRKPIEVSESPEVSQEMIDFYNANRNQQSGLQMDRLYPNTVNATIQSRPVQRSNNVAMNWQGKK
jgi:hypothetical protein